jgi:putative SOS response-associated peptidase YedK
MSWGAAIAAAPSDLREVGLKLGTPSRKEFVDLADLIGQPRNLAPRFNIAPTTPIEVVRAGEAGNELVPMRWGLVPCWWKKSLSELPSTFNARAETVTEKPMFRAAFKARRCIIPASGFYEFMWTLLTM